MGYHVADARVIEWEERPPTVEGQAPRQAADMTTAERIDVGPQSVVAVEPMTALQVRNEGDEELVLFIYGAPPERAGADFFDDVEL